MLTKKQPSLCINFTYSTETVASKRFETDLFLGTIFSTRAAAFAASALIIGLFIAGIRLVTIAFFVPITLNRLCLGFLVFVAAAAAVTTAGPCSASDHENQTKH